MPKFATAFWGTWSRCVDGRTPATTGAARAAAVLAISGAGLCMLMQTPAVGQGLGVNGPNASVRRDANGRIPYTNPPVSPYVNLGFNPNGISNYQTLVRPMIDEREASRWQSEILQPPRQTRDEARDGRNRRDSKVEDAKSGAAGSVRFMHYSHFFGGLR